MRKDVIFFIVICLVNLVIALLYLFWNLIWKHTSDKKKNDTDDEPEIGADGKLILKNNVDIDKEEFRKGAPEYIMKTVVMILCPIVGILFFVFAYLKYRFLSIGQLDLSDVEFGKKKSKIRTKADEEREKNIVPIEESIAVSDQEKMRANMINVLLGSTDDSLSSIALALNSDDSEVAHYAAAMLQNKLDEFRETVRKKRAHIDELVKDETTDQKTLHNEIVLLIRYMNFTLRQRVFSNIEQQDYVGQMEELCEILYHKDRASMEVFCYEWIFYRWLEQKDYEKAQTWGNRLAEEYPEELSAYTTRLKLYFESRNKEKFFEVMAQLKSSNVTIDKDTLALIRMMHE